MTFGELYKTWANNINSEYILPTLEDFYATNIIIHTDNSIEETLRQLKHYKKLYKIKLKQEKDKNDR